ncbi:MinD/ParA family protein [Paenibacillus sp. JX-17]|uniref:MinD/ParA family protein n=1 Tax=Paenibacillus lacisoli TaxID=3064525 RepID=A0ABT9CAY7_9BACL|nr:MinD/ParA family protein [Paenibacillus sp. JX-17]MDO7905814.1 MinD/ParA family protein [Paenibacillus sp. JX-17]
MSDQAQTLRQIVSAIHQQAKPSGSHAAKIVTVASGKGGVGKSNFTLNFALALQSLGRRVLVFDADIGMANIDVLMGTSAPYNLIHLLRREKTISEIVQKGAGALPYIAGGSGMAELFRLSEEDLNYFADQVNEISGDMDYIFFDTGAGLSKENMKFIMSADECLVVTTPEPTSMTDAYALIKVVHGTDNDTKFKLIVNRVENEAEATHVANSIQLTTRRFLQLDIPMLGYMSDDRHVVQAVKKQTPFSLAFPGSQAARDLRRMAGQYASIPAETGRGALTGIKGFMQKWMKRTAK